MENDLHSAVEIRLPKTVCLVLFELLTRSYEKWRETNPDDSAAEPMLVNAVEHSDRKALWQLEGALERTLPELFSSDYKALLRESERLLGEGHS